MAAITTISFLIASEIIVELNKIKKKESLCMYCAVLIHVAHFNINKNRKKLAVEMFLILMFIIIMRKEREIHYYFMHTQS